MRTIYNKEFHPNIAINVESMDRNSFTAFAAPILIKLTTTQWHYMEIFCNKFHPNWSRNMESIGTNSFMP
jgi:hypothetical protein